MARIETYEEYFKRFKEYNIDLKRTKDEFKTKELCEYAVSIRGSALEYVPEELKTKELCTIAVDKIGRALEFVPEKFKSPELCKIAVEKHGGNLEYVPENLKTFELCEIAVTKDGYNLEFVPEDMRTEEICEAAVFTIFLHDSIDDEWLDEEERYNFIKENVPDEFYEELAEKYDIDLPEKGKGR